MTPLASIPAARSSSPGDAALDAGILRTVVYADLFDHPLTVDEVHRGLIGVRASRSAVELRVDRMIPDHLARKGGYVFLPGRGDLVDRRRRRQARARDLWPAALTHARRIASFPFVRMVAITGSLALDSVDEEADVDLLVVTESGRLWICRALVGLFSRWVARRGVVLCPNFFLSEGALELEDRNLYTAHELIRMIPVAGGSTYRAMWDRNPWARKLFPNAGEPPHGDPLPDPGRGPLRRMIEALLRTRAGGWLDGLERRRKLRRSSRRYTDLAESRFDADCFKGHFDGHARRTLTAYRGRLATLERQGGP